MEPVMFGRSVDNYITRELATDNRDTVGYVATSRGVVGVSASEGQTRLTVVNDGVEWRAKINRDLTQGYTQQSLIRACNQLATRAAAGGSDNDR